MLSAMTTQEIAEELVALCSQGKFKDAITNLYADNIVSVEAAAPPGGTRETNGLQGVIGKADWWQANHDVHSASVGLPISAGAFFAVTFKLDVTFKPTGARHTMEEIAVYQTAGGKIVREEFFYAT